MKKIIYTIIASMLLISASCKNDDDNLTPLEQLPPPTQTGENTFGCLLDGEAFLPGPGPLTLDCVYQFVSGGYFFSLQANKRDTSNNSLLIGCSTEKLEIAEGQTYELNERIDGNAYGSFFFNFERYRTSMIYKGEMTITKLNFNENIVSGFFWFDVIDKDNKVHKIREGRFDMRFTQ